MPLLLLLLGLSCGVALGGEVWYNELIFSGACNEQNHLNGMVFQYVGYTKSGSPYYKALDADEWLYYDPDCSGGGDGQGRWIVDDEAPSLTVFMDLDGDGVCNYRARVDSTVRARPPTAANWKMKCGGPGYQNKFVTLMDITTTRTTTTRSTTATTTTPTTSTTSSTSSSTSSSSRTDTSTTTTSRTRTTTSRTQTSTSSTSKTTTSKTFTGTRTRTTTRTRTGTTTRTRTWTTTRTGSVSKTTTRTRTGTGTTLTTTRSSTSTETTTTSTGNGTTSTTRTTSTASTSTTFALALKLSGACAYKSFLNGLVFESAGFTAAGTPYFKALGHEQYIYHDSDCGGVGNGTSRWIIDPDAPNASMAADLDQDGVCNYHARIDSNTTDKPPANGTWSVFCGEFWEENNLVLEQVPYGEPFRPKPLMSHFKLTGTVCGGQDILGNLSFDLSGFTKSGSPFFASREHGKYIYHDPSCSGAAIGKARWVLDDEEPDANASRDLDGDGTCDYHARASDSGDAKSPPEVAMWHVHCGDGSWEDSKILLMAIEATTTTEAPLLVNGAPRGLPWHFAAILLVGVFGSLY